MSSLHCLITERNKEIFVLNNIVHFVRESFKNFILLTGRQLEFHVVVSLAEISHNFDNLFRILILVVLSVPFVSQAGEFVTIGPQSQSLVILCLVNLNLGDFGFGDAKNFLPLLELVDLLFQAVILLFKRGQLF